MIRFQHHILIDASPSEVFAHLSDIERIPEWQRNVVAITKHTPGAVRAGTLAEETLKMMGRTRSASVRVAVYTPVEMLAYAGDTGFGDYYCALELTPTDRGTALLARTEFRLHGLWKLLQPLMAGAIRRESAGELAALKHLIETRQPAAAPSAAS